LIILKVIYVKPAPATTVSAVKMMGFLYYFAFYIREPIFIYRIINFIISQSNH
jgi:hypothetical protein